MGTWVDYKEIKQLARIDQVLTQYGVLERLKRRGENLVGPCPIHKGTNATQFHVSLAKNNFNCFGDCHGGGNVIDFVAKIEGIPIRDAALKLQEWFGLGAGERGKGDRVSVPTEANKMPVQSRPPELAKEKKEEIKNPPLSFALKHLDPDHPYLAARRFTAETITEFGLGYCAKGLMKGRIVIPIHNENGELVAYAGRWPGEPPEGEGKYKLPAGFHKSLVVFNLHRVRALTQPQSLILVEGFFDCLRLWQAGIHNVVGLMGSSLSPEQEALVVEAAGSCGTVTLLFDEDEAGRACRSDALTRLSTHMYVKVISLGTEGAQPDGFTEEEIKNLGLL